MDILNLNYLATPFYKLICVFIPKDAKVGKNPVQNDRFIMYFSCYFVIGIYIAAQIREWKLSNHWKLLALIPESLRISQTVQKLSDGYLDESKQS